MSKKIYLSPSDQTANRYAWGSTNEAVQCRRIADACETALKRCGFSVKNNQTASMQARVAESDRWGADLHVPIHTNAFNKSVTGTRLFCWNKSGEGYRAARAVYAALAPLTPGTSENIQINTQLYEIRVPAAPTVYIEVDFHDVAAVAKWIVEHTVEIGEAIAKGICKHFGVDYVLPAAEKEPEEEREEAVLYRVQVGAYSVRANAEKMLEQVRAAGFSTAFIRAE